MERHPDVRRESDLVDRLDARVRGNELHTARAGR